MHIIILAIIISQPQISKYYPTKTAKMRLTIILTALIAVVAAARQLLCQTERCPHEELSLRLKSEA